MSLRVKHLATATAVLSMFDAAVCGTPAGWNLRASAILLLPK